MSLNKVILIGNLGRDPELRYMPNGDAVCNFSIATSESWNDRNSGQRQERTEWHNITLYRRLAEVAGQYLKKGSQVYIEGKIQSRSKTTRRSRNSHTRRNSPLTTRRLLPRPPNAKRPLPPPRRWTILTTIFRSKHRFTIKAA